MIEFSQVTYLREKSELARERICKEQFNVERVLKKMEEAMAQGYETILIKSDVPVVLDDTIAAKNIEEQLTALGICNAWENDYVPTKHKSNSTGIEQKQTNLCVSVRPYRNHRW